MGHRGTVGDAGVNVFQGDLRVMGSDDFLRREAVGEEIEHHGDPDAMSADAGTATAAGGIDPDMGVEVCGGHGGVRILGCRGFDCKGG